MALLAGALVPGRAESKSCIDHAYEQMDAELEGVTSGDKPVAPPPELKPLDRLLNSAEDGKWVLFTDESYGHGKFYELAETVEPTPGVASYIESWSEQQLETACGYSVSYTPIVPGRYTFVEEHSTGGKTSAGIDDPVLHISPDRRRATLEFSVKGVAYSAGYRITCAFFDWENRGQKSCAMTGTPATPPPGPAPPVEPDGGAGCRSCSMQPAAPGSAGALALLVLTGALLLGRRRRPWTG